MLYTIRLYFKYIKYCIFTKPLNVYSLDNEICDSTNSLIRSPNKFYTLTAPNGKRVVAIFHKLYRSEFSHSYKGYFDYTFKYNWVLLGYVNQKIIKDCSWNEFEDTYASLFFPHLSSEKEITIGLVTNVICPKDDSIASVFRIRFTIK